MIPARYVLKASLCLTLAFIAMVARPGKAVEPSCQATRCINLLFDGDSISVGSGSSPGHGLDQLVAEGTGDYVQLHNVAVGGRPVSECSRLYGQLVAPAYETSIRNNIIAFHAGDNDIAQGRSADQTYNAFRAYVAAAHRQGWKVVVTTELRHADFPPIMEEKLEDYNALLRRNDAGADVVVDLDAEPRLRVFSYRKDPALFSRDGVHPSDGGYALIADMLVAAVKRVGGR